MLSFNRKPVKQTIIIRLTGKVQGVYFRQSALEQAIKQGITGTARNLADGTVELVATGTASQLEVLLQWCHRGPRNAQVDKVDTKTIPLQEFGSFQIIR
jgi:acylphosphatase